MSHHIYYDRTGMRVDGNRAVPRLDIPITDFPPSEAPPSAPATPAVVSGHFPDYDRYLKRLADAQRYKLRINAHKGDLGDIPVAALLRHLKDEVTELEEAIGRGSEIEIILEASDICNFALGCVIAAIRGMNGD